MAAMVCLGRPRLASWEKIRGVPQAQRRRPIALARRFLPDCFILCCNLNPRPPRPVHITLVFKKRSCPHHCCVSTLTSENKTNLWVGTEMACPCQWNVPFCSSSHSVTDVAGMRPPLYTHPYIDAYTYGQKKLETTLRSIARSSVCSARDRRGRLDMHDFVPAGFDKRWSQGSHEMSAPSCACVVGWMRFA